jgi:glycosyltransferase involved in cell wall biosynthesis
MKILYDHQIFTLQKYGGISRYFSELMTRFSKDPAIDYSVTLRFSFNEHLLGHPQLDTHWSRRSCLNSDMHVCSVVKTAVQYEILRYVLTKTLLNINQKESERLLKKQDFDLFHPTYYDPYFLKYLQKKPYAVTVYDMIHETFPEYFPRNDPISNWKKQVLEHADGIVAISESTKADIIHFFHIDPDRIHVIYLGNPFKDITDAAQYKAPSDYQHIHKPYILFVGNRSGYKNFDFFIDRVTPILRKDKELLVCCAGGGPFTPRENEILEKLQILNRVHYVEPNDHLMKKLYNNARAFIFPSLYEGFGLPILEAFSCGCPVILCNTSSLPEIGGDAALYFHPSDPESFTNTLERLLNDDTLRMQLTCRGYQRIQQFSWEKTAMNTKKIYDNLLTQ